MRCFSEKQAGTNRGVSGRTIKTHRGVEAKWLQDVAREIRTRPAGWLVMVERVYRHRSTGELTTRTSQTRRYDTQAEAEAAAAQEPVGPASLYTGQSAINCDCWTERVWVEQESK